MYFYLFLISITHSFNFVNSILKIKKTENLISVHFKIKTNNTQIKKRLKELSLKSSDIYRVKKDEYSQTYIIPKKMIKFNFPRELSEKEKQKRAIRLQQNIPPKTFYINMLISFLFLN